MVSSHAVLSLWPPWYPEPPGDSHGTIPAASGAWHAVGAQTFVGHTHVCVSSEAGPGEAQQLPSGKPLEQEKLPYLGLQGPGWVLFSQRPPWRPGHCLRETGMLSLHFF